MYDRIIAYPSTSDLGIYAVLRSKTDAKVWNGTTTESWNNSNIATYALRLSYLNGDAYGFTVPSGLPKPDDYTTFFYKPATVFTPATTDIKLPDEWEFHWTGRATTSGDVGDPVGLYADANDLRLLLGAINLEIESNRDEDTATEDNTAIQAALDFADQYINLELRTADITVPVDTDTASDTEVAALKDIDTHLAAWWLHTSRGLFDLKGRQSADDISGRMAGFKEYADEQLGKLKILLEEPDDVTPSTSGAISVVVGDPKRYPGTGCVTPVSVTLPAPVSPFGY